MKKLKEKAKDERYVAVLTPRYHEYSFDLILRLVLKAIESIELQFPETKQFTFIYDGTRGSQQFVGAVNVLSSSMNAWGKHASKRKFDLDVEYYGPKAQYEWVDQVLEAEPDIFIVLDNKNERVLDWAVTQARKADVFTMVREIPYVKQKQVIK